MNNKQKELIDDLASDMKEMVEAIEKGIKTTQNNYGRYMGIISQMGKGNQTVEKILALALIQAGASPNGVASALKVLGHGDF